MEQKTDYYADIEKEVNTYKAIFETLPQSLFLFDENKNIIDIFNAKEAALAGVPINEILGKNILTFANDTTSPFYQSCKILNQKFDHVLKTNEIIKFQYKIFDNYFEDTISKVSGNRVLCQVQDITDIVFKQHKAERERVQELNMAMIAGGMTSWNYDVKKGIVSSKHENNVITGKIPLKALLLLIMPEYRDATVQMFDSIKNKSTQHGHVTVRVKAISGEVQWCDVHATPLEYDEAGNVSLIVGSQKDVTNEYIHNEKIQKLITQNELILNNTNSGFMYLDKDLKVEWENISKIFVDEEIVCLLKDSQLCMADCYRKDRCSHTSVSHSLETKARHTNKFSTSSGIIVESTAQPVLNEKNEIEGIVLRIDDITDKENSMCELAKAKELAEQSDKLKSAFLANMSHEIRTPLNSIVGFAQLLPDADSKEEQKGYIDMINSNSEVLLNLINDILDLSKIEAGYFNCNNANMNLSELFHELEMTFRYKMDSTVELRCEVPQQEFYVYLDRLRISQIITNFMTNAIKFTQKGYIRMGYEINGNTVKLFVEDTGIGMNEDESRRVFGRFEKFNIFVQGTGLGTSIAKAIVDAYNGMVGVKSSPGKGSTFWAILPINALTDNAAASSMTAGKSDTETIKQPEMREPASIKILVVEDNDSNYMLMKALLREYKLARAYNGKEGVDKVSNESYDIVLMDMRMPVMDGIEATQTIRKFNTEIPIVAVTANAFDEDRKSALSAGANDFLTKPLNKAILLETINKYINK